MIDPATVPTSLAAFGVEEVFQLLVVALFLLGPILKQIADRSSGDESERAERRQPRPRPRPTAQTGEARGGTVTWEDLLAGRGPAAPPPAVDPEPVATTTIEPHEHEDLVPDALLGDLPSEGELERHGGDVAAPLVQAAGLGDTLQEFSAGERELSSTLGQLGDASLVASDTLGRPPARARTRFRITPRERRRAIVLAEVFGAPLSQRRPGSYPGPPQGVL